MIHSVAVIQWISHWLLIEQYGKDAIILISTMTLKNFEHLIDDSNDRYHLLKISTYLFASIFLQIVTTFNILIHVFFFVFYFRNTTAHQTMSKTSKGEDKNKRMRIRQFFVSIFFFCFYFVNIPCAIMALKNVILLVFLCASHKTITSRTWKLFQIFVFMLFSF